jgi:hypothetical protein
MTAGSYYYWLHVFHRIIHNRQLKSLSYQIIQHLIVNDPGILVFCSSRFFSVFYFLDTRMVYPACYFLQRYQNLVYFSSKFNLGGRIKTKNNTGNKLRRVTIISIIPTDLKPEDVSNFIIQEDYYRFLRRFITTGEGEIIAIH